MNHYPRSTEDIIEANRTAGQYTTTLVPILTLTSWQRCRLLQGLQTQIKSAPDNITKRELRFLLKQLKALKPDSLLQWP